jgi:hypothetical protein
MQRYEQIGLTSGDMPGRQGQEVSAVPLTVSIRGL